MSTETKLASLAHINTLWELLELALGDLEKSEQCNNVVIDMGFYHVPNSNAYPGMCAICAAGSVMRETLGAPDDVDCEPLDYDLPTQQRLRAINQLRMGQVVWAWDILHENQDVKARPKGIFEFNQLVVDYNVNRREWWNEMRQLLSGLKAANL